MAITYTWKITSIKTKDEGNNIKSIVQTYWTKTGTDESGNTGVFNGATPFSSDGTPASAFIPFEKITEQDVLKWIQDTVTGHYEEHVNSQIQKQIDAKHVAAPVEAKMPWAKDEPVAAETPTSPVV